MSIDRTGGSICGKKPDITRENIVSAHHISPDRWRTLFFYVDLRECTVKYDFDLYVASRSLDDEENPSEWMWSDDSECKER